jgi:hypothetical protein
MTDWVACTDGRRVWATDPRTGMQRRYMACNTARILSVTGGGKAIAIVTDDGKVRIWNPETDSVVTHLQ